MFVWPLKYCLTNEYLIIKSGLLYRLKVKINYISAIEEVYGFHLYALSGNRFNPSAKKYKIVYKSKDGFRKQSVIISPSDSFIEQLNVFK